MKVWFFAACLILCIVPTGFALSIQTDNPLQPEAQARHKAHKAAKHKAHKTEKHSAHRA